MSEASIINLNSTTPETPAGAATVKWQGDDETNPRNVSAYVEPATATAPGAIRMAAGLTGSGDAPVIQEIQTIPVTTDLPSHDDVLAFDLNGADPTTGIGGRLAWKSILGGVDARTGTSETITTASRGKLVTLSNASAIAVTLDSAVSSFYLCAVDPIGAGAATLTPSSGTINGSATLALTGPGWLFFTGTNWYFIGGGSGGGSSPLTTKGDLYTYSSADARLAVGTNGKVLMADSAQTTGLKWKTLDETDLSLSDITTNNASTSNHGFLKKLSGASTDVLRGDGTFGPVAGGGGGSAFYPTLTPPVSSNFGWVNQIGATVTDNSNRMTFTVEHNGTDPNFRYFLYNNTLPSTPFSVVAAFTHHVNIVANYYDIGLVLYPASGTLSYDVQANIQSGSVGMRQIRMNSPTSVNAVTNVNNFIFQGTLWFFKMTDDGTRRKSWYSVDGWDWMLLIDDASGAFLTPNKAGIVMTNFSSLTWTFSCYHWAVYNSIV